MTSTLTMIRRRQRLVLAICLVIASVLAVMTVSADERAVAATECGAGDANRATLKLGASDQTVRPCISGTNLKIKVPKSCVVTVCDTKYKVTEIRRHGRESVTYADGTSEQLWHFSFKELNARRDITMRTDNNAAGQLAIKPEGAADIGGTTEQGEGMYTDVWVSDGTFNITFTDAPSVIACSISIKADSPLVEIVQGGTIRGCGLDLDAKYLVSYNPSGQGSPVRLPNTSLEVTS